MRAATARRRSRVGARAPARRRRTRSRTSPPPSRTSATAPFSATTAASGVCAATARLQPIGRPVTAITGSPASRSAASAATHAHRDRALGRQRVVDVGQHAAHAARGGAGRSATTAATEGGITRGMHKRPGLPGRSGRPALESARFPRSVARQDPRVRVPGLEQLHIATALTRTMVLVGEFRLPSDVRPAGSSFELEPLT